MHHAVKVENLKPLTSLRFFAAMMIVVLHSLLFWPWFQGAPSTLTAGVSFFFVLSGFILTHAYNTKGIESYSGFIRDRISRVWPLHVFALLMLILFVRNDALTYDGSGLFNRGSQFIFNLFLLQSLMPFEKIIFSWNSVSWSISTELFFYIAFPFLLIRIKNNWLLKLSCSALVSVVYVYAVFALLNSAGQSSEMITPGSATSASPIFRGFEFCLGMASWVLWVRYIKDLELSFLLWTIVELAAIALVAAWVSFGHQFVISFFDIQSTERVIFRVLGSAWVFALLLVSCASGRGLLGKILSNSILVYLGEISFAVYMVHIILMKFFAFSVEPAYKVTPVVFFAALFILASACHLWVEKPMQKLLRSKGKTRNQISANQA